MPKIFISPQNKIGSYFIGTSLVLLILCLVNFNLFEQKLEIQLQIEPEIIQNEFLVTVKTKNSNLQADFTGQLIQGTKQASLSMEPPAIATKQGYAEGEVFVYNETYSPKTIIAASRIQSPEGLIFRTEEKITIPAQGKVKVKVKADKPGKEYELEPTTFTFPGLKSYPDLYENIYAKNESKFSKGEIKIGIAKQEDIDNLKNNLEKKLQELFLKDITSNLPESGYTIAIKKEKSNISCNAQPNEQIENLICSGESNFQAVIVNQEALINRAKQEIVASLPRGKNFLDLTGNPQVEIKDFSEEKAVLSIKAQGQAVLSSEFAALDKKELASLNLNQLKDYLLKIQGVKDVSFKFSPFFLKRIPKKENNIILTIKQK